jgi:type II secretory pathway component PulK
MDKKKNLHLNNEGQAMIAVLCIMTVMIAVCFSLLLSSYQMFASVNDERANEKWYQQALSFSAVLDQKITSSDSDFKSIADTFMASSDSELDIGTAASGNSSYGNINLVLEKNQSGEKVYFTVKINVMAEEKNKASVTLKYLTSSDETGDYTYQYIERVK